MSYVKLSLGTCHQRPSELGREDAPWKWNIILTSYVNGPIRGKIKGLYVRGSFKVARIFYLRVVSTYQNCHAIWPIAIQDRAKMLRMHSCLAKTHPACGIALLIAASSISTISPGPPTVYGLASLYHLHTSRSRANHSMTVFSVRSSRLAVLLIGVSRVQWWMRLQLKL